MLYRYLIFINSNVMMNKLFNMLYTISAMEFWNKIS